MKQVTLVSFYGHKTAAMADLIKKCRQRIQGSPLRRVFTPYHDGQIHGTLIGMEQLIGFGQPFNANMWSASKGRIPMDFKQLIELVQESFPIRLQFGGFSKNFNGFESQGLKPYDRSFQVQLAAQKVTLIGWPFSNGASESPAYPTSLANFREAAAQCGVRHKWGGEDNDLFMVLGTLDGMHALNEAAYAELQSVATEVERDIRDMLAARSDTHIDLRLEDILYVQYQRETLPLDSSECYRASRSDIDATFLANLYQ